MNDVRLDKWLWAVRLFKTRKLALEACRGGLVKIGGSPAKPSRIVHAGDRVEAKTGLIHRTVLVIEPIESRVAAKIVAKYVEDLTPPEEYERGRLSQAQAILNRPKGAGRPTKKDRRDMEKFFPSL